MNGMLGPEVAAVVRALRRAVPLVAAAALLPAGGAAAAAGVAGQSRPLSVAAGQAAVVPASFQPAAASFLSPAVGFVLGGVGCKRLPCAARLVATADGGVHWRFLNAPAVRLVSPFSAGPAAAVSTVAFASRRDGWLLRPGYRGLWSTHDGGAHWRRLFLGGPIEELAVSPGTAYAVVARRGGAKLLKSPAGRNSWARVRGVTGGGVLAVSGRAAWLGSNTRLWATADGVHWHRYPFRCPTAYFNGLASIAAASASHVLFLCLGSAATGSENKAVLRSVNGGRTVHFAGKAPFNGIAGTIAVPPNRSKVVTLATSSAVSMLDRSADGGRTWKQVRYNDGGAGWSSLAYVSRTVGWLVHGEPGQSGVDQLLRTTDAGVTWHKITFRSRPAPR
jgi:photosystem II stability/assembly factor-like uncharacterized protein